MICIDIDGDKWEYVRHGSPQKGEYYINSSEAQVVKSDINFTLTEYMIVKPTVKTYTIGGIEFEETGEVRQVELGEWFLQEESRENRVDYWYDDFGSYPREFKILKPVRIL